MADKLLASNEIKKFLAAFKSLQLVAEELEVVGKADLSLLEKKKEMDKLAEEKNKKMEEILLLSAKLNEIKKQEDEYKSLALSAKAEAGKAYAQAKEELEKEVKELKEKHLVEIKSLEAKKESLIKEVTSLVLEVEAKQKSHKEVLEKIEALKRGL
jgi:chromosome segregation ATPase